jgi:hypothetical protein
MTESQLINLKRLSQIPFGHRRTALPIFTLPKTGMAGTPVSFESFLPARPLQTTKLAKL